MEATAYWRQNELSNVNIGHYTAIEKYVLVYICKSLPATSIAHSGEVKEKEGLFVETVMAYGVRHPKEGDEVTTSLVMSDTPDLLMLSSEPHIAYLV